MKRSIHILMEGAPGDVDSEALVAELQAVQGVVEIHHVHVWELGEDDRALEAHVVVETPDHARWAEIKREIKSRLESRFDIHHSTLELEGAEEAACCECRPGARHHC